MNQSAAERKSETTPFLMFYTSDWIAATNAFTLEQRGFYAGVLFAMWERKGGLPDDCRWLANCLNCDPRTVRRLRQFFISEGKLESRDGFLVNRRMMQEIARFLRRKLHRQTAYVEQPSEDAENDFVPIFDGSSTEDRPDLRADLFEFTNEIKETSDHIPEAIFQKPEDKPTKVGASPPATTVEQEAAGGRAGPSPEAVIFDAVHRWTADEGRARTWITTHVGLYGLDVVRDGVAAVVAEMAAGKPVAQPVQLASCVIRRLDARKPAPGSESPAERGEPPWVVAKRQKGMEALEEFYRQKRARLEAEQRGEQLEFAA